METFFFFIVALIAVVSSLLVITCRNPINSALSLILTFFCLATFYVMLNAPFMAAIQVIVYAGAIMVLIVFVIMLLNIRVEASRRTKHSLVIGSIVGIVMFIEAMYLFSKSSATGMKGTMTPDSIAFNGHTELIGKALFTDFLLPFEVTSILLLVAIVGSVILAKRKL